MKLSIEITWRSLLHGLLAAILVWAALGKLANLQEFYALLLGYRLPVPLPLLRSAAIILPWLELLTGILLLIAATRPAALAWATVLFALFTAATLQAWVRGLPISCGCLNLGLIGLSPGSALAATLESARFAFFRALVLGSAAAYLFRSRTAAFPQ